MQYHTLGKVTLIKYHDSTTLYAFLQLEITAFHSNVNGQSNSGHFCIPI